MNASHITPAVTSTIDRAAAMAQARMKWHIALAHEKALHALFPKQRMHGLRRDVERCLDGIIDLMDQFDDEDDAKEREFELTHTWLMAARVRHGFFGTAAAMSDRALAARMLQLSLAAMLRREHVYANPTEDGPTYEEVIDREVEVDAMMFASLAVLPDDVMQFIIDANTATAHDGAPIALTSVQCVRHWQAKHGDLTIAAWRTFQAPSR